MQAKPLINVPESGAFPSSDQFPFSYPNGTVNAVPEPPSSMRPFGLTVAVVPRDVTTVKQADFMYDEDAQVGRVRDGGLMVPLSRRVQALRRHGRHHRH